MSTYLHQTDYIIHCGELVHLNPILSILFPPPVYQTLSLLQKFYPMFSGFLFNEWIKNMYTNTK